MKVQRACLFVVAALGVACLIGCAPTQVTKYDKAKDLQDAGKFSDAITQYKAFIAEKEYPGLQALAMYKIALCYKGMGKNAEAIAQYKNVEDQWPGTTYASWSATERRALEKSMEMAPPAMPAPMTPAMPAPMAPKTVPPAK